MRHFSEFHGHESQIPEDARIGLRKSIQTSLIPALQNVNLSISVKQAQSVVNVLNNENATWADLKSEGQILSRVVQHEVEPILLMYVPAERVVYYQDPPLFGEQVANKFPKVLTDIQEAGKCFALGRYTATVFHLMRVMESAVHYLGSQLQIALVGEKNWHNILDEVDKAIKKLPVSNPEEKATRNKLAEALAHLRMVKDAWRNDVMHPKETYTEEESERVFRNVKDFMVHLATKL